MLKIISINGSNIHQYNDICINRKASFKPAAVQKAINKHFFKSLNLALGLLAFNKPTYI